MKAEIKDKRKNYAPTTFSKVMSILTCFSFARPELTASEISEMLQVSKSTLYRYLNVMVDEQYLMRIANTNHYAIGMRLVELAAVALCRNDIRLHGEHELNQLSYKLGMNSNLGILYNFQVLHIAFSVRDDNSRMYSIVGRCAPLTCTAMGKALLSTLSDEMIEKFVAKYGFAKLTPLSITSLDRLMEDINEIRDTGFSYDNEENAMRSKCLGHLVYEKSGNPVASISVTSSNLNKFDNDLENIKQTLQYHANTLSAKLGYFVIG